MTKRRRTVAVRPPWHRRTATKAVAALAGAAAILFGGHEGLRRLRLHAAAWPEAAFDRTLLDCPAPPPWLQSEALAEALAPFEAGGPASRMDPQLLPRLARALEQCVWVRAPRLKWQAGRLHAEWDWRLPVAAIPWEPGKACYLDAAGVVIPPKDAAAPILRACLRIELPNLDKSAPPSVGSTLPDPRILPAVRLAAALLAAHDPELDGTTLFPRLEGGIPVVDLRFPKHDSVAHWGYVGAAEQLPERVESLIRELRETTERWEFDLSAEGRWQRALRPSAAKPPS